MTEEKILQAAEREFLEKGFDGARTTSIARHAGVTHAMLHYYFHTKENLFEQVMIQKVELIWQSICIPFSQAKGKPLDERLRVIVTAHFQFMRQHPALPRFGISEVFGKLSSYERLRSALAQNVRPVLRDLQQDIDEAVARGEADPIAAETLLTDIIPLNIMPFLLPPPPPEIAERLLAERLEENIRLITRRVMKNNTQHIY